MKYFSSKPLIIAILSLSLMSGLVFLPDLYAQEIDREEVVLDIERLQDDTTALSESTGDSSNLYKEEINNASEIEALGQNLETSIIKKERVIKDSKADVGMGGKMKRQWTMKEVRQLGYVPDEIIVRFKVEKIDMRSGEGKNKTKNFIISESRPVAERVFSEMKKKSKKNAEFASLGQSALDDLQGGFLSEKKTNALCKQCCIEAQRG